MNIDVTDVLLFFGVIAVLLITIGIGALVALGMIPFKWILLFGAGFVGLIIIILLAFGVGFLIKKLREKRQAKKSQEPKEAEKSAEEFVEEPAIDYQAVMEESIAKRCESQEKFLLCRIAVENIAAIEKTHGRKVTEIFLKEAEKRMIKCLKEEDKLYRARNDEYVAVIEDEADGDWKLHLGEIDQTMRSMFELNVDGKEICIDTSVAVGFAIFPSMGATVNELLELAGLQLEMTRDTLREEMLAEESLAERNPDAGLNYEPGKALEDEFMSEPADILSAENTEPVSTDEALDLSALVPDDVIDEKAKDTENM